MPSKFNRRAFNKASATAALGIVATGQTAASATQTAGANERIRLGFLGVANRGGQLITAFQTHDDMEIVALCDVDSETLAKAKARCGGKPDTYGDFRQVIDRDDIDAVVIATPDHWHAIQTIDACNAGKDVYVEKPVSLTVYEGRQMVRAARRNQRVVQVGTHRRSGEVYAEAAQLVQAGTLGKVTVTRSFHRSNMFPNGMGKSQPTASPPSLDWDMWLGPRPERPYQANIAPYKFRWWTEYCSQISNNGVHSLDMIRWLMNATAPSSICCMGGKFAVDDDRTIPDTAETIFQFPDGWFRSPRRGRPEESPVRGAKRRCAGGNCPDTQAEHTLGLSAARGRGRIWPPRNSLNCGLRSTWSRCHTNRSTAPSRRSPTQGCATFAALTSLHPWAVLGSPRCGCRGESQRAGDTNPGLRDVAWGRSHRSTLGGWGRQGSLSQWHEEASAWGSSPSRLCVLGRSLSHANDQESHPLPDPAAARRCGGRRPVIRC
jgi:predicted dehydrogenase